MRLLNKLGCTLSLVLLSGVVWAAKIDTVKTYSAAMKKEIKAVVITPDNYSDQEKIPVVYLLHGFSGNHKDWIAKVPSITEYADRYHLMIVCPEGNFASWYFDSPEMPDVRYETYISRELVNWIDAHYNTVKNRKGRAITGLSMGGHGALYLSFKHLDVYSIAGSMSGGVDLRPFPGNWGISDVLGTYAKHPEHWEKNSVINMTHLLTPDALALIFACGSDDFFYDVNVNLHEKLLLNNIPHTFISAPGGHTWEFWENALHYEMDFINTHFKKQLKTDQ
ncbi:esterase family protein [Sinomicrobium sp. FJxs]|uniref:Esterase family protein n=2 Tax=Sinomicrobium weinanense TaxID=2842200 RepID=A0A926Q431_9FLAO|nr:esterase family protein [Sinomicrobium weinanense]MBU3125906.1 esterase family protein [Sinomicrobium weinanense]